MYQDGFSDDVNFMSDDLNSDDEGELDTEEAGPSDDDEGDEEFKSDE